MGKEGEKKITDDSGRRKISPHVPDLVELNRAGRDTASWFSSQKTTGATNRRSLRVPSSRKKNLKIYIYYSSLFACVHTDLLLRTYGLPNSYPLEPQRVHCISSRRLQPATDLAPDDPLTCILLQNHTALVPLELCHPRGP